MTTARVGDVDIHYVVDGPADAPPLLLCNSLGTDVAMWQPQVDDLADPFRVIRHDLRGHGASSVPSGEYTVADLGRDAEGVLDAVGVERVDVCGESLGGFVVLWLAAHRPGRVRRVVAANTAARIGTVDGWQARIDAVHAGGMAAVSETVVGRFFSDAFRARSPDVVRAFRSTVEATDAAGYVGCCTALRDGDLRSDIRSISAPVLVIAGADDLATPVADSRWLAANLADSRLKILDAAHLSSVERPDEFNAAVAAFLDE